MANNDPTKNVLNKKTIRVSVKVSTYGFLNFNIF